MLQNTSYKWPFIFALFFHSALFGLFLVSFSSHHRYTAMPSPAVNVIIATAVDQAQIDNQLAAIKAEKDRAYQAKMAQIKHQQEQLLKQQELAAAKQKQKEAAAQQKELTLKAEQKRKEDLKQQQEAKAKAEQEAKHAAAIEKAMAKQMAAEQQQMAAAAAQMQGQVDKYKSLIIAAISQHWIVPDNIDQGLSCQLLVHVAPGGTVINVDLVKSSGNQILDRSAVTAVLKSSPLPVPSDNELFNSFREIKLTVRPEGFFG